MDEKAKEMPGRQEIYLETLRHPIIFSKMVKSDEGDHYSAIAAVKVALINIHNDRYHLYLPNYCLYDDDSVKSYVTFCENILNRMV